MSWRDVAEIWHELADTVLDLFSNPPPPPRGRVVQTPQDPHTAGAPDPGDPLPVPAEREGKKTSEFKATIGTQILAVIAGVAAVLVPGFPADAAAEVIGWALGAVGLTSASYSYSRAKVKTRR